MHSLLRSTARLRSAGFASASASACLSAPRAALPAASICSPLRFLSSSAASGASAAAGSHGLSHVSPDGRAPAMVDVGGKSVTRRLATAQTLVLLPSAVDVVFDESRREWQAPKGPVLVTAIIAGTSAVKQTSNLLPFCHPLPVERVKFDLQRVELPHAHGQWAIRIHCEVGCTARTGVEMEALTGASVAALTIYDMLKALSHDIVIAETKLVAKSGGKSDYASK